jgi:hypothetical protein
MFSVGVICQTGQSYSMIDLTRLLYILSSFILEMFAKPFISLIIWMESIVEWTRKWRININMEKCEVCIFAKKDLDQHQKELVVNNYSFKYNPTPRLRVIVCKLAVVSFSSFH